MWTRGWTSAANGTIQLTATTRRKRNQLTLAKSLGTAHSSRPFRMSIFDIALMNRPAPEMYSTSRFA